MYQITVNINDKPHQKRIPQCWNDVQWIDYIQALQADGELFSVLEALTGIPTNVLDAMSETDFSFIETQCSFFWTEPIRMTDLPSDFVQVQIANDTWQKLIDAEQEFKRVNELQLPEIAAAQSIVKTYTKEQRQQAELKRLNDLELKKVGYLQSKGNTHVSYVPLTLDSPQIKDIEGVDIKGLPAPIAIAYWDFFFGSSLSGQNDGQTFTTQEQMTTRFRQELKRCNPSLGLRHSMRLRMEIRPSTTRYWKKKPTSSIPNYYSTRQRPSTLRICASTMSSSTKTICKIQS